MKKKILFYVMTAWALSTACSVEQAFETEPKQETGNIITLNLGGAVQSSLTRTIANGDEKRVDNVIIYMFDENGDYEATINPTVSGTMAQFNLSSNNNDLKTFYVIANRGNFLPGVDDTFTTTTFEQTYTEDCLGDAEIQPPLLMSGSVQIDLATSQSGIVKLNRRVARFDIDNDSLMTHFVIENIYLHNAPSTGLLFGDGWSMDELTISESWPVFNVTGFEGMNSGAETAKSVFYLFPTMAGTKGITQITFSGRYMGKPQDFVLNGSRLITANNRYTLKVSEIKGDIVIDLDVVDWEENEVLPMEPEWPERPEVPQRPGYAVSEGDYVTLGTLQWLKRNLGATKDNETGDYFQWGRETPFLRSFTPDGEEKTSFSTTVGPVKTDDISGLGDMFVKTEPDEQWLNWVNWSDWASLWAETNVQGPCPADWRLPTYEECEDLFRLTRQYQDDSTWKIYEGDNSNDYITLYSIQYVFGSDGERKAFPGYDSEHGYDPKYDAGFWTSTTNGQKIKWVLFDDSGLHDHYDSYGTSSCGMPVRCVRKAPEK